MTDREKVIKGLEACSLAGTKDDCIGYGCPYLIYNDEVSDDCQEQMFDDALALLKEHEKATKEPKRIDLPDETKAWLNKMDAVDVLGNIADICMDWDGYRTANGLGALINEIWAYARYCADRLHKAQELVEPSWRQGIPFCGKCGRRFGRGFKYCPDCGRAVKWE